jgi:Protein of unknown function (DUF2630).
MSDEQVHGTIEQLVSEEHELWELESKGRSTDSDRRRLAEIKVQLDQSWDLLRQRRALREFELDDDGASCASPTWSRATSSSRASQPP